MKPVVLVGAGALFFAGAILLVVAFHDPRSPCDGLLELTTATMSGSIKAVQMKGTLVLGRAKVQQLTADVQKAAVFLKACCIAEHEKPMSGEELHRCMSLPMEFEVKLREVAAQVSAADLATKTGNVGATNENAVQAKVSAEQASQIAQFSRSSATEARVPASEDSETQGEVNRTPDVTDKATATDSEEAGPLVADDRTPTVAHLSTKEQVRMNAALVAAIKGKDSTAVQNALTNGADPHHVVELGAPWYIHGDMLELAVRAEMDLQGLALILNDVRIDQTSRTVALARALFDGRPDVARAIMAPGIDAKSVAAVRALCSAAQHGYTDIVRQLIQSGIDVNDAEGATGHTPLHCAAGGDGNPKIVELLVEAGAEVNAKDDEGMTPLDQLVGITPRPLVMIRTFSKLGGICATRADACQVD